MIIVGGGIVGTYCAYEFATHGLKTVLLERQELAAGASSRGGGLLLKGATDVYAAEIVPHLLTNQHLLEEFIQRHNAEVDYVREGSLFVCFEEDAESTQTLMEEMNAAGLPSEWWSPRELQGRFPALTRRAVGGRFIPSDAQLTPLRLCTSFAKAARETGADIRTHQNVLSLLRDSNHQVIGVQTDQESFYSRQIVLATNAYTGHLIPELKSIIIPTRGQAFLTFPVQPSFLFACASNQDL
ncbi:MAG: FAD-dependent oxidoreductase [Terriglobia bacterium]